MKVCPGCGGTVASREHENDCVRCGLHMHDEEKPVRSREWEQMFLDSAARLGGLAPDLWTQEVRDRMDKSEKDYGDTWATRRLWELVKELDEEGMDLGGWSALIGQRLYPSHLHADTIEAALTLLREIASLGARERLLKNELVRVLRLDG